MEKKERYKGALDLAWEDLQRREATETARLSGSRLCAGKILLPCFDSRLQVDMQNRTMEVDGRGTDELTAILALHYLSGCGERGPTGELISFAEAPGGEAYYSAFKARSIDRLARAFADKPSELIMAGAKINGKDVRIGSFAVEVQVFPKLMVTAILWEGDEEVPTAANVLFDSLAPSIVPTEDLAVAGSMVVARLIKAKG